jgi:TPR repeat protein
LIFQQSGTGNALGKRFPRQRRKNENINGIFRLACDDWDQGRIHAAFRLFLKAAKAGDLSAQLNLSAFYGNQELCARGDK